jgi:RNA polymerase sigma-70 factor, ECF subfamily
LSAVASAPFCSGPRPLPAEATRLLYERHSGRIFGYCLGLLGSREEAEDALQTTFMNVQRGLDRGVVPQFELAWLFKIARNVCYNRTESSSRRRRLESGHDLDSLEDVVASPEGNAGVSMEELTRALGGIPERQRRALLLREFQGMSYDEIAGELDITVAAVETLLFRARCSLADQLEQQGMPRRRGAAASMVALFRWFFDGSAVPLKLAGVTAAVATTATLVVAPTFRANPAGPVHVIPVVNSSPATKIHVPSSAIPNGKREAATRGTHPVTVSSPTVETRSDASAPAQAQSPAGMQMQSDAQHSSPVTVTSPSTRTSPAPVPAVPDVTQSSPLNVPDTSTLPIALPQVSLPLEVPELPKLP